MALLILTPPAKVHQGPPFPLIVDPKAGPYRISVWADHDIGAGTFFIIPEQPRDGAIPDDLKVDVGVQPVSGRLAEALYPANRDSLRGQVQYQAAVEFDTQEFRRVRLSSDRSYRCASLLCGKVTGWDENGVTAVTANFGFDDSHPPQAAARRIYRFPR